LFILYLYQYNRRIISKDQEKFYHYFKGFKILNSPHEIIVVNVGKNRFILFEVDINIEIIENKESAVEAVYNLLKKENIIPEYAI